MDNRGGESVAGDKSEMQSVVENINVDKVGVVNLDRNKDTTVYKTAIELLPDVKSVVVLAN